MLFRQGWPLSVIILLKSELQHKPYYSPAEPPSIGSPITPYLRLRPHYKISRSMGGFRYQTFKEIMKVIFLIKGSLNNTTLFYKII